MKIFFVALVVLFAQTSFAANDCIRTHAIRNYTVINNSTLEIRAGRDTYIMDVGYCHELPWARRIAFESFSGSRVCRGDKLLVLDSFSDYVKQRCHIFNIKKR